MTFHEKSATAILAITVLIYGSYFSSAFAGYSADSSLGLMEQAPHLIWAVVLMVGLTVIAHIAITVFSNKDDRENADFVDERDKQILSKCTGYAFTVLAFGVVVSIGALIIETPVFLVAHMLLGALVLAEVLKSIMVIVSYRRGF